MLHDAFQQRYDTAAEQAEAEATRHNRQIAVVAGGGYVNQQCFARTLSEYPDFLSKSNVTTGVCYKMLYDVFPCSLQPGGGTGYYPQIIGRIGGKGAVRISLASSRQWDVSTAQKLQQGANCSVDFSQNQNCTPGLMLSGMFWYRMKLHVTMVDFSEKGMRKLCTFLFSSSSTSWAFLLIKQYDNDNYDYT